MFVRFTCLKCAAEMKAHRARIGETCSCSRCGEVLQIPEDDGPATKPRANSEVFPNASTYSAQPSTIGSTNNSSDTSEFALPPGARSRTASPQTSHERQSAAASTAKPTDPIDLPYLHVRANWPIRGFREPRLLVRGQAENLEPILQAFLASIRRKTGGSIKAFWATETSNVPRSSRPLRLINEVRKGHQAVTDVTFTTQGNDLYLSFKARPKTRLTYLRAGLYSAIFFILFCNLLAAYLFGTGAYSGWAKDYADKHGSSYFGIANKQDFLYQTILVGNHIIDLETYRSQLARDGFKQSQLLPEIQKQHKERLDANPKDMQLLMEGMSIVGIGFMSTAQDDLLQIVLAGEFIAEHEGRYAWFSEDGRRISEIEAFDDTDLREILTFPELAASDSFASEQKKMVRAYESSVKSVPPWSAVKLFWSDPKIFFWNYSVVGAILAGLIGFGLYMIPPWVLRYPCAVLCWPTPEAFTNLVYSHAAQMELILNDVLLDDFGVDGNTGIVKITGNEG